MAYDDKHFKETVDAFVQGKRRTNISSNINSFRLGKFKGAEKMITSRIYIDDISKKGLEELVTNKDEHIKILVTTSREKLQ